MSSAQLAERPLYSGHAPWAHTARKCKSGVLNLIHKVNKVSGNRRTRAEFNASSMRIID